MTETTTTARGRKDRSLIALFRELPAQLIALAKAELDHAKQELIAKLIQAGVGIGMLVVAGVLLFFMLGVLVAAAVLGLATVFSPWLAALLTAAGLLVLAGILALIGIAALKRGVPPVPTKTIESVKQDVRALKGEGDYDD